MAQTTVTGEETPNPAQVMEGQSAPAEKRREPRPVPEGYTVIYRRWITRKGVRVFPPKGQKAWRLPVKEVRETAEGRNPPN